MAVELAARPAAERREGLVGDIVAGYLRWGVPGLALLGAGVLTYLHGVAAAFVGMLLVFFGQLVMVPLVAGGAAAVTWLARQRHAMPRRSLQIFAEPEPHTSEPRGDLVGTLRVTRAVSSPLSHVACAAYRLVGTAPGGDVDEASAGELRLEADDGRVVSVDARQAQVRLAPPRPPFPVVRPDAALMRLLAERALEPTRGPVALAERVLRDGDRVRVRGTLGTTRSGESYRGDASETVVMRADAIFDA